MGEDEGEFWLLLGEEEEDAFGCLALLAEEKMALNILNDGGVSLG